jgi:hypothetical protein
MLPTPSVVNDNRTGGTDYLKTTVFDPFMITRCSTW